MNRWTFGPTPTRVLFGIGERSSLPAVVDELGLADLLIVSTPGGAALARSVGEPITSRIVGFFDRARVHVPVDVLANALDVVDESGVRGVVAVGGGSAIGLAKGIVRERGIRYVAIPTTYAGSEMTPVWGTTEDGRKTTGIDPRVYPAAVVYDPELNLSLPLRTAVLSGINALAHAAEALYSPEVSPLVELMAERATEVMIAAIDALALDPSDLLARAAALEAAWLCGTCLANSRMSLHHALCHSLAGRYDLSHAETHAALLPYVLAYVLPRAAAADRRLRRALADQEDPEFVIWRPAQHAGDVSLKALGVPERELPAFAEDFVVHHPVEQQSPGSITRVDLERLLHRAWGGESPVRAR